MLLLLTLFGQQIFPLGADGALSIGLLYATRGVGAGIGPLVARRFGGDSQQFLRRAIGPSIILTGIGYTLVSGAPSLLLAALGVMIAHIGGSTQWVFSTSLLQINVPNRLQGRVFAVEGTFLTLATALSSYSTGVAADAGWSPPALALLLSGVFVLPGVALGFALWPAPHEAPRTENFRTYSDQRGVTGIAVSGFCQRIDPIRYAIAPLLVLAIIDHIVGEATSPLQPM